MIMMSSRFSTSYYWWVLLWASRTGARAFTVVPTTTLRGASGLDTHQQLWKQHQPTRQRQCPLRTCPLGFSGSARRAAAAAETATVDLEPHVLESLVQPALERKSFGGVAYWDTHASPQFRVLFVLGGPGAGKGTQSALLQEHYGHDHIHHFSVGELLRNAVGQHRELIDSYILSGQIVPVEISLELLQQAMLAVRHGQNGGSSTGIALVDGFPRNADNLQGWCRQMTALTALSGVLVYTCPLSVLEQRILQRGADGSGRSDDNLTSLRRRFTTFQEDTQPVVNCLRNISSATQDMPWKVHDIAGDDSLEQVWLSTQKVMNGIILDDVVSANAALLEAIAQQDGAAYRRLVDASWYSDGSSSDSDDNDNNKVLLQQQEGTCSTTIDIAQAQVDVISGKHVAVSYQRCHDGIMVRETRIWMHQAVGWRNVHFSRQPL